VFVAAGGSPIYVASRMETKVAAIKDLQKHDDRKWAPTGNYPWGMAVTPDFKTGFVANTNEGSLSVIDLVEMKTVATVPVDKDTCGVALRK
jgi:DNA-binding beta-propeller fold protein YncE